MRTHVSPAGPAGADVTTEGLVARICESERELSLFSLEGRFNVAFAPDRLRSCGDRYRRRSFRSARSGRRR